MVAAWRSIRVASVTPLPSSIVCTWLALSGCLTLVPLPTGCAGLSGLRGSVAISGCARELAGVVVVGLARDFGGRLLLASPHGLAGLIRRGTAMQAERAVVDGAIVPVRPLASGRCVHLAVRGTMLGDVVGEAVQIAQ